LLTKDLGSSIKKMTSKGLSNKRIIKNFEPYWQKTRFSKINNTKLCALVAKK
jgi:hypothetical protein